MNGHWLVRFVGIDLVQLTEGHFLHDPRPLQCSALSVAIGTFR